MIEVLIVIAITALLAGMILTYSSQSRDQVALYIEQAKLAQTVARAKSLTISTYNQPTVPCGYGVHFNYEENSYLLFSYDAPQCGGIQNLSSQFMTEVAVERMPGNLAFGEEDAEGITDILFLPPNPDTWIWLHGSNATSTEGRVPLVSRSGVFSVEVLMSNAGQITF